MPWKMTMYAGVAVHMTRPTAEAVIAILRAYISIVWTSMHAGYIAYFACVSHWNIIISLRSDSKLEISD